MTGLLSISACKYMCTNTSNILELPFKLLEEGISTRITQPLNGLTILTNNDLTHMSIVLGSNPAVGKM